MHIHAVYMQCKWHRDQLVLDTTIIIIILYCLPHSSDCSENYVELYEKTDCTGYRLGRVCRSNQYRVYYTFINIGCVRYHSGASTSSSLTGFKLSFNAEDVNECLFTKLCSHTCTNVPGGYQCSCPRGYFLSADGRRCFGEWRECEQKLVQPVDLTQIINHTACSKHT